MYCYLGTHIPRHKQAHAQTHMHGDTGLYPGVHTHIPWCLCSTWTPTVTTVSHQVLHPPRMALSSCLPRPSCLRPVRTSCLHYQTRITTMSSPLEIPHLPAMSTRMVGGGLGWLELATGSKLVTRCDILHLCLRSAFPQSTSCSEAQAVGQATGKASKATYWVQVRYGRGPSSQPLPYPAEGGPQPSSVCSCRAQRPQQWPSQEAGSQLSTGFLAHRR